MPFLIIDYTFSNVWLLNIVYIKKENKGTHCNKGFTVVRKMNFFSSINNNSGTIAYLTMLTTSAHATLDVVPVNTHAFEAVAVAGGFLKTEHVNFF